MLLLLVRFGIQNWFFSRPILFARIFFQSDSNLLVISLYSSLLLSTALLCISSTRSEIFSFTYYQCPDFWMISDIKPSNSANFFMYLNSYSLKSTISSGGFFSSFDFLFDALPQFLAKFLSLSTSSLLQQIIIPMGTGTHCRLSLSKLPQVSLSPSLSMSMQYRCSRMPLMYICVATISASIIWLFLRLFCFSSLCFHSRSSRITNKKSQTSSFTKKHTIRRAFDWICSICRYSFCGCSFILNISSSRQQWSSGKENGRLPTPISFSSTSIPPSSISFCISLRRMSKKTSKSPRQISQFLTSPYYSLMMSLAVLDLVTRLISFSLRVLSTSLAIWQQLISEKCCVARSMRVLQWCSCPKYLSECSWNLRLAKRVAKRGKSSMKETAITATLNLRSFFKLQIFLEVFFLLAALLTDWSGWNWLGGGNCGYCWYCCGYCCGQGLFCGKGRQTTLGSSLPLFLGQQW